MKNWSFSKKVGSAPRFLSFESSQQDHLLPSNTFTSRSDADDQNRRTHYNSVHEGIIFPICIHQDQKTTTTSMFEPGLRSSISNLVQQNGFINLQPLGSTDIRSSSKLIGSPPGQLTVFYAGSVSVYEDISPEKADAIMLLAGNGPVHHSPANIGSPTLPSIVSETGSGSNGVIGLGATKNMLSLSSTSQNNQTKVSIMAPSVGLPQARKASLARFVEKRKERFINISPYFVNNKSQ